MLTFRTHRPFSLSVLRSEHLEAVCTASNGHAALTLLTVGYGLCTACARSFSDAVLRPVVLLTSSPYTQPRVKDRLLASAIS